MRVKDKLNEFYSNKKWGEFRIVRPNKFSSISVNAIAHYAKPIHPQAALEIGGGSGELTEYLSQLYNEYIVTEFSTKRANLLKQRFKKDNIKIIENDIEEESLPYPNNYFDFILMCSVLEHLVEPISVIKYCHRLLKSKGRIVIYTPNLFKWTRRIKMLFGIFPKTGGGNGAILDGGHLHYFTHNYLKKLLIDYGEFNKFRILPHGRGLKYLYAPLFSECLVEAIK